MENGNPAQQNNIFTSPGATPLHLPYTPVPLPDTSGAGWAVATTKATRFRTAFRPPTRCARAAQAAALRLPAANPRAGRWECGFPSLPKHAHDKMNHGKHNLATSIVHVASTVHVVHHQSNQSTAQNIQYLSSTKS